MGQQRRFAVIVRAGDTSLHRGWLEGGDRNWDLIVSWFGSSDYQTVADERVIRAKGLKWDTLGRHLIFDPSILEAYEYLWLPDDDLETTAAEISRLFDITAAHGLAVSQPALTSNSYFSHLHTMRARSFLLRYTDLVECMAPCLSRATIRAALPYFAMAPSGWGLDCIWARLEDDNDRRAAIIDACGVRHTRPVGSFMPKLMIAQGRSPRGEGYRLMERFGISFPDHSFHTYAGIGRGGARLGRWMTAVRQWLDYQGDRNNWVEPRTEAAMRGQYQYVFSAPDLSRVVDRAEPLPSAVAPWLASERRP